MEAKEGQGNGHVKLAGDGSNSKARPNMPPRHGSKTTKIKNPQQPKTRPPKSFRDKFLPLPKSLPFYSGPYTVGTMEIEVPVDDPRHFSEITRKKHHILQLETVLMTIYYPAAFGSGSGPDPAGHKKWSRLTWLPRPRVGTAKGYGNFAGIGGYSAVPFFAATTMFTKLPAYRNAQIAEHWPPTEDANTSGFGIKNVAGPPPDGESAKPCFPLMLFSHGLGGTRTMYSGMCGEFASYGFVCVAVEHRDGSGPRSFVNHEKTGYGSREEREKSGEIDHTNHQRRHQFDAVDYIFPKYNPYDTNPNNDKGPDKELRSAQIRLRLAELEEAYKVCQQITAGKGAEVAKVNMRRGGFAASSSHGLEGVDWNAWKGAFHADNVIMLGHSFGAATTVEVLRSPEKFPYISAGVIYDIWGAAVESADAYGEADRRIRLPLLAINSEAFAYWEANFNLVSSLVKEAKRNGALAWSMTVRGTVHVSQSDFALLYPNLCSLFLKMTANPQRAMDLNINATLEFLKIVMPSRIAQINRALQSEGLLEVKVIHSKDELPMNQIRQPEQKYIALKLAMPHEFSYRLRPRYRRTKHVKNREGQSDGKTEVTPESSFENSQKSNDEIWMHFAPTKDELDAHGVKSKSERDKKEIANSHSPDAEAVNAVEGEEDTAAAKALGNTDATHEDDEGPMASRNVADDEDSDVDLSRQSGSRMGSGSRESQGLLKKTTSKLAGRITEGTGGGSTTT